MLPPSPSRESARRNRRRGRRSAAIPPDAQRYEVAARPSLGHRARARVLRARDHAGLQAPALGPARAQAAMVPGGGMPKRSRSRRTPRTRIQALGIASVLTRAGSAFRRTKGRRVSGGLVNRAHGWSPSQVRTSTTVPRRTGSPSAARTSVVRSTAISSSARRSPRRRISSRRRSRSSGDRGCVFADAISRHAKVGTVLVCARDHEQDTADSAEVVCCAARSSPRAETGRRSSPKVTARPDRKGQLPTCPTFREPLLVGSHLRPSHLGIARERVFFARATGRVCRGARRGPAGGTA
jgi:hypothetical protein